MAKKRRLEITEHDRRLRGGKCGCCGGIGRHIRKIRRGLKDQLLQAWLSGNFNTIPELAEHFDVNRRTVGTVASCERWFAQLEDKRQEIACDAYHAARKERIKTAALEERAKHAIRSSAIESAKVLAKKFLESAKAAKHATMREVETCLRVAHLASSYSVLADGEIPEAGDETMTVHDMVAELRELWPDAFEDLPQPVLEDQPVAE